MSKLFQEIIFRQCTDDELVLIADFLNAAFDDNIPDAEYDELFVQLKKVVRQYADTDIRHGEHGGDQEQSESV